MGQRLRRGAEGEREKGGDCQIEKCRQGMMTKKWKRRRLGGIIAAVTGCRIFLDWEEHQFGEGTTQIYIVLARLISVLLLSQQQHIEVLLPAVIFFDNACALWKYATNVKRCDRTAVATVMKSLHYMIDIWHIKNHSA